MTTSAFQQCATRTTAASDRGHRDTSAAARRRDGFWRELELGPGDVLLLPPNTVHRVDVGRSSDRDNDSDSGDGGGACTGELSASLSVWWDEGGALSALRTAVAKAMDVEHVGLSHFIMHTRWRDATCLALGLASVVRAASWGRSKPQFWAQTLSSSKGIAVVYSSSVNEMLDFKGGVCML